MRDWYHRYQEQRPSLLWWSLALCTAAALKWYYSVAAVTQLGWILEPITWLLRLLSGWQFKLNDNGEWQSIDAGIVLVKACAGINFMIMSLLVWCWAFRPRESSLTKTMVCIEWPLFLAIAVICAWVAAITANTLRILAIVELQPLLEQLLKPEVAHRTLGLLIYLPALCAQALLMERHRAGQALLVVCAIYASVSLLVPLITGNALANSKLYAEHALLVMLVLIPIASTACRWRKVRQ